MQAVLITAYKDRKQLDELLGALNGKFKVYLHIDAKSDELEYQDIKDSYPLISVIKKYQINWGGYNHIKAVLELISMAVEDNETSYIHIISGQDFPVRNKNDFDNQFENSDLIYMTCIGQEEFPNIIKDRLYYRIINSNWDEKRYSIHILNRITSLLQKIFGVKRNSIGEFSHIYKGMIWSSFPIEVGTYVLDYVRLHPEFLHDLQHTLIPEEFFLQTILVNSKYKDRIVKRNLRYTDWNSRYNSSPAYLDLTDFEKIVKSRDFFARKIDSNISCDLVNAVHSRL